MAVGIITAVLFVILLSKFVTKRMKNKKPDQVIRKIHKPMGYLLCVLAVIHLLITMPLFQNRPLVIYILGIFMMMCAFVAAGSYFLRGKLGKKWFSIHRVAAILILMCVCAHVFFCITSLKTYQKKVSDITITQVDISNIPNGVYEGECDVEYIYARVKVTVMDGAITDIKLIEHRNERGGAASKITSDIINAGKINVDSVSGATNSSKVIKKAVENALEAAK